MRALHVLLAASLALLACGGAATNSDARPDFDAMRQAFVETGEVPEMLVSPTSDAQRLALAEHLVDLDSDEGQALLADADADADYEHVASHFETQVYRSYCGVASSVIALQALDDDVTQASFFDEAASEVAPMAQVLFGGMTLQTLHDLLEAHGADAELYHAADLTLDEFRALAVQNLGADGDYVLVNYLRAAIDQETGGHISPLAAYDADTDRFLVMDVATYKYPPVWVEAARLFAAMNEVDSDSGLSRGMVFVAAP